VASMPSIKSREINIVQSIPIGKTMKFWEGLRDGKVYATKCPNCKELYFPPVADCPTCHASGVEWVKLSSEAEIETFTHVVIRPASFQQNKPYTIAIGRLKEGVKVLAWLSGFKMSEIKVGMKARLVAKVTSDEEASYGFIPP
jgi:uncharacterized OB-fold protein